MTHRLKLLIEQFYLRNQNRLVLTICNKNTGTCISKIVQEGPHMP